MLTPGYLFTKKWYDDLQDAENLLFTSYKCPFLWYKQNLVNLTCKHFSRQIKAIFLKSLGSGLAYIKKSHPKKPPFF